MTEFPVTRTITLNDDGTLATQVSLLNDTTTTKTFIYENDRLVRKNRVSTKDLEVTGNFSTEYTYDTNGGLVSSSTTNVDTGRQLGAHNEYEVDSEDRVTVILADVFFDGTYLNRHELTYDNYNNIIKHDIYDPDGRLNFAKTHSYERSTERTPNLIGFQSASSDNFVP